MNADTTTPAVAEQELCREALESSWQQKVDEVIALSKACCGLSEPAGRRVRRSQRLQDRTARAYDELAAIEAALARASGCRSEQSRSQQSRSQQSLSQQSLSKAADGVRIQQRLLSD